jgi:hypothetical protein
MKNLSQMVDRRCFSFSPCINGMPCAVYYMRLAAYYLFVRFRDNLNSSVLHAINGGGQNHACAILTGALTGAQTGLR